ncbi:hypothetical protein HYPSUDRAFT_39386 [Hypholoma sublateritium FD-334 SS-4]|uniref:Uncharacterized protein n=1 Tax=Hypholoma sublateritium (strain FD-334 SS-4) TaxID=945553 RepID=A0A0D2PWI6_HYPSF|nr:hypothetical protein HYPSUDRAFT_39386 [Hypholoma sublateritium FD-334 SS-4]
MTPEDTMSKAQLPPPPVKLDPNMTENSSPSLPQHDSTATRLDLRDKIAEFRRYSNTVLEEIVKPSVQAFMETCDTNPRIAAIVATPALLASLLVVAFLILSASALVLWSIFTITAGVMFVVVGGLLSLAFKLVMVLLATIPLAGMATGLLVAANSASKFIITKIPNGSRLAASGGLLDSFKNMDWKSIVDGATTFGAYASHSIKEAGPMLIAVRDVSVTLATAIYSAFNTAWAAFQVAQSGSEGNDLNLPSTSTGTEEQSTAKLDAQQGAPNLSRRKTFQTTEDDNPLVGL